LILRRVTASIIDQDAFTVYRPRVFHNAVNDDEMQKKIANASTLRELSVSASNYETERLYYVLDQMNALNMEQLWMKHWKIWPAVIS
jgi:hypothetical protein